MKLLIVLRDVRFKLDEQKHTIAQGRVGKDLATSLSNHSSGSIKAAVVGTREEGVELIEAQLKHLIGSLGSNLDPTDFSFDIGEEKISEDGTVWLPTSIVELINHKIT